MFSNMKIELYIVVMLFLVGIASGQSTVRSATSSTATSYLNEVLDLMQQNALHTKEIDWPIVRSETLKRAEGAQTTVDTYPAIYYALTQLKEHHSFLSLPDSLSDSDKKRTETALNSILGPYSREISQPPASPFGSRSESACHLIRVGDSTIAVVIVPHCFGRHSKWEENAADFQSYANACIRSQPILTGVIPKDGLWTCAEMAEATCGPCWQGLALFLGRGILVHSSRQTLPRAIGLTGREELKLKDISRCK